MSLLERIYYFHGLVTSRKYPNASHIAREFEVSLSTARRDIQYMKDRLLAPLSFDYSRNGYCYEESFRLPFEDRPKSVFILALLQRLAVDTGILPLKEVSRLFDQMKSILLGPYKELLDRVYCEWVEVEDISPDVFEVILQGLLHFKRLRIHYVKPTGEHSEREIDPARLIQYQGRWYLYGFCHMRNAFRMFHLARIQHVVVTGEQAGRIDDSAIDSRLKHTFGIFKGKPLCQAKILFSGDAACIVRHQRWHPEQILEETNEGVILTVPVSDSTELKMKVLQFGSRARVLEPEGLKEEIAEEIRSMARGLGLS